MSNLYELSENFSALMKCAEEQAINADGEISEALSNALDGSEIELGEKTENIIKYVKNLRADADAYKAEAAFLTSRSNAKEKKAKSLIEWLKMCGITKHESTYGIISSKPSKAIEVSSMDDIPEKYLNTQTKTTTAPDKGALKKAIESGEEIKGVELVSRVNVSVK